MCIPHAQYMVMMHEGQITLKGVPSDLQSQGSLPPLLDDLMSSKSDTAAMKLAIKDSKGESTDRFLGCNERADTHKISNAEMGIAKTVNDRKTEDEYNAERLREICEQQVLDPSSENYKLCSVIVEEEEEREEG
ncbi:hypothetical protein GGI23_007059, partial [Coemansia sp. RSA 2559]